MAKKLAKVLQTEFSGDLSALAQLLQAKGRGKDTILAHITPGEAKKLKAAGGRGSRNPDTGLLEFDDGPLLPEVTISAPYTGGGGDVYVAQPYQDTRSGAGFSAPPAYADSGYTSGPSYLPTGIVPPPTPAPTADVSVPSPGLVQRPDEDLAEITPTAQRIEGRPFYQKALGALGGPGALAQLGLTGLLGIQGQKQARDAAKQAQQYAAQQQAMAQPYQVSGQRMATAAERGELTPQSRQAYEAARAQMAQAAESRGGVGAAQAATQLEAFRQQLLQNQYTYGLQIANIGDNIVLGAIRTGMQADQYVNQATMQFYGMLGNFAAQNWGTPKTGQATQTTGTTQGVVS